MSGPQLRLPSKPKESRRVVIKFLTVQAVHECETGHLGISRSHPCPVRTDVRAGTAGGLIN